MQELNDDGAQKYKPITRANFSRTPQAESLDSELREDIDIVSRVLPFRANNYLLEDLIDWSRVPDDPIYQLTFPQRGMLSDEHFNRMRSLVRADAPKKDIDAEANRIRLALNPHPAGQMTHNVPEINGEPVAGMQHKYRETTLFFPTHGQTCHAYCSFCFRWAQFVGLEDMKFANKEASQLASYLRAHPEVTDVLFTGGDPMIMKTKVFQRYIEPLLEIESVRSIRIGTKSLAYWPQRFVTDDDADDMLRLLQRISDSGRQVAIMAHASHPVEFSTDIACEAIRRVRGTGANIRMQSPIIRHVNDDVSTWADLWRTGVQLGCIPYYMFVERDTGARNYFEMPLVRCWNIFRNAFQQVSGLARTVRGPSMSCFPGKVHILGVTDVGDQQAFCLEFLQAREPDLVRRPFFAVLDPSATWYDQLKPLTQADEQFFIHADDGDSMARLTIEGVSSRGQMESASKRPHSNN